MPLCWPPEVPAGAESSDGRMVRCTSLCSDCRWMDRADRSSWHHQRFLGSDPQPISLTGVAVNERLQPLLATGAAVENVFVTASNLPHWDPVHEGSGEGVALATAHKAAAEVLSLLGASSQQSAPSTPEQQSESATALHVPAGRGGRSQP